MVYITFSKFLELCEFASWWNILLASAPLASCTENQVKILRFSGSHVYYILRLPDKIQRYQIMKANREQTVKILKPMKKHEKTWKSWKSWTWDIKRRLWKPKTKVKKREKPWKCSSLFFRIIIFWVVLGGVSWKEITSFVHVQFAIMDDLWYPRAQLTFVEPPFEASGPRSWQCQVSRFGCISDDFRKTSLGCCVNQFCSELAVVGFFYY